MSEDTAVLLPAARVDVYCLNKKTVNAANALVRDWRFSRVAVRVVEDGIDSAITDYEQHMSPDLVILETADISDEFTDKLGVLAENCVEGTEAIVVGPKNDVELYRHLVGMGVRDYLVSPVKQADFAEVVAKTLLDKKGIGKSRLIAIIGSKGGVGTTTVSHMLASIIADKIGHKTLLMDMAGGWGTMTIPFAAEITTTLSEAVRQVTTGSEDDIKRLLNQNTEKLTILPAGGDPLLSSSCEETDFENMLDHFLKVYPVVVIDLSGGDHKLQKLALQKAHDIIAVTSPLLPAVRNCRLLLKEITGDQKEEETKIHLVLNMEAVAKGIEVSKKEIETLLETEIALTLPYDVKAFIGSEAKEEEICRVKTYEKIVKPLTDFVIKLVPEPKSAEKSGKEKKDDGGFFAKIFK
ncbi:MAG: type II secretion protein ATPase [Micavibrio sp.]|nr:MAG: type II secretion protein ATPase [Micavibrio sp.]